MTPPAPLGPNGKKKNPKAILILAGLAVVVFMYLRSRSSSSTSTTSSTVDPNAIDPATGMTYAQEQAAALAQQSSSSGTSGTSTTTPTADQITTADGTTVSAALSGLSGSLTQLQTQQANDEALLQSTADAAAQASTAYNQATSLGTPGPTTIYEAPVVKGTVGTINDGTIINNYGTATKTAAPKVTPAPAPAKAATVSTPPKATTAPKPVTVTANKTGGSSNSKQGVISIH